MSTPGTTQAILRSLAHLEPPVKGAKFALKGIPTYARHRPAFVQPRDRIAFWNIVPGDVVRVKTGKVKELAEGIETEDGTTAAANSSRRARKIRGEGKVVSIDRERNVAWLRDVGEESGTGNGLAPNALRHVVPRLVDPEAGEEKGYGPNVMAVPRPIHYSNLQLKIPDEALDKKIIAAAANKTIYARRVVRTRAIFNKHKKQFVWRRFAIYRNPATNAFERVEIPWPEEPERRKVRTAELVDKRVVGEESWIPWRPEDPVLLPPEFETRLGRQRSTPAGEAKAEMQRALREAQRVGKESNPDAYGLTRRERATIRRPPPIAQPPTPSETIGLSHSTLQQWANDPDVKRHVEQQGGRAFAAHDYLNMAPSFGPAASAAELAAVAEAESMDPEERDPLSGKLKMQPTQEQLDSFPIELLMAKDLTNPTSLANRMKKWQVNRAREGQVRKEEKELEEKNLKALRKLKL